MTSTKPKLYPARDHSGDGERMKAKDKKRAATRKEAKKTDAMPARTQ